MYGAEEIRHDQLVVDPHLAPARPAVAAAAANLRERPAVRDSGAWLEDKRDAVADHIRRCRPQTSWGPPAVGDSGIC